MKLRRYKGREGMKVARDEGRKSLRGMEER
jgi:hypothetical protein